MGCGVSKKKVDEAGVPQAPEKKEEKKEDPKQDEKMAEEAGTNGAAASAKEKALASPAKPLDCSAWTSRQLQPLVEIQGDTSRTCADRVSEAIKKLKEEDRCAEKGLNACCEILEESAMAKAAEQDARLASGESRRLLEGLPVLVKANVDVENTLSTASMPGLATWKPSSTAPVVQKLINAGAIVVGKTNMPEAAFGAWGWSPVHGLTKNPHNSTFTCAGSSSGTAAALAAGFASAGIGSDTGGSVRGPAECCGIVGLRPSRGRYSSDGVVPCDPMRDTAGPMGKTVKDVSLLDAVITAEDLDGIVDNLKSFDAATKLDGVKVGVPPDVFGKVSGGKHPGQEKAMELAMEALKKGGATCNTEVSSLKDVCSGLSHETETDWPGWGLHHYLAKHREVGTGAGGMAVPDTDVVIEASAMPAITILYTDGLPPGKKNMRKLQAKGDPDFEALQIKFQTEIVEFVEKYIKYFEDNDVDVLLMPCIIGPAPKCLTEEEYKTKSLTDLFVFHGSLTWQAPLLDFHVLNSMPVPSLAVPTKARHVEKEGYALDLAGGNPLPAGVLLFGKPMGDRRLLDVGVAIEEMMK